jgi:hypothetical protein
MFLNFKFKNYSQIKHHLKNSKLEPVSFYLDIRFKKKKKRKIIILIYQGLGYNLKPLNIILNTKLPIKDLFLF